MLEINIPGNERWDEKACVFVYDKPATLRLEHSLLSLSKWESKWHKPFRTNQSQGRRRKRWTMSGA